jgi:enamine deaminase RidA (YjgF/YER057c/UK114 family)
MPASLTGVKRSRTVSTAKGDAMTTLDKLCAPGVHAPTGYSQVVKVTGAQALLFLAGQLSYGGNGEVMYPGDFTGQARRVFALVQAHVEAAGGTLASVVKLTTYVTDIRYRPDFRAVRAEFFGDHGPASTMVQVSALSHPDLLIEVEAIAVL